MKENKETRRFLRKCYAEEMKQPPKRGTKIVVWRNPKVKKRLATIDHSQLEKSDRESE